MSARVLPGKPHPERRGETSADGARRTFIAVALPGAIRAALHAATADIAAHLVDAARVRWVRKPENLHLTVKFLGNVTADARDGLAAALADPLSVLPPFAVDVRGLGAFPSPRHADVIWAGIDDPTGGMARIATIVERAVAAAALGEREERPFRAHVTLGRAKPPVDLRAALVQLANRAFGSIVVDEVHIYESQLGRGGATHTLRSRLPLGSTLAPP